VSRRFKLSRSPSSGFFKWKDCDMAIKTHFDRHAGVLTVTGDKHNNAIIIGRDVAGHLQLNGEDIKGHPTNVNTQLIQVFGGDGDDVIMMDETNALPAIVANPRDIA
jgi:hypothetical protein